MKNLKALLALALFLAAPSAFASHLGPAGCGLGNVVFGKDNQVLAATTNGSTYTQYFGITSGTSNCTEEGGTAKMTLFIESNEIALQNDAARGQGETVQALASMMGCQDAAALGTTLKANYGEIFESNKGNAAAISTAIQSHVQKSETLARSCEHVG